MKLQWLAALSAALGAAASAADTITLSGADPSMAFDGHGGLSAGASSRLLRDYAEPQRSQILDYLWKPGFGANLQICKIEIGGDTQSTDGTEPSFRHYREEAPQCGTNRGYEMWLLQEAAARSASVQSYLLSWGIPNWVGNASYFSAENIDYQVGYAKCVRETIGGSHPHYLGVWNERSWGSISYVVSLRNALDAAGLAETRIVVPDGGDCDGVTNAAAANATFASAVYALGEHYPCKRAWPRTAEVGRKFWASEDYSTVADVRDRPVRAGRRRTTRAGCRRAARRERAARRTQCAGAHAWRRLLPAAAALRGGRLRGLRMRRRAGRLRGRGRLWPVKPYAKTCRPIPAIPSLPLPRHRAFAVVRRRLLGSLPQPELGDFKRNLHDFVEYHMVKLSRRFVLRERLNVCLLAVVGKLRR
jgi:hypothetical protein